MLCLFWNDTGVRKRTFAGTVNVAIIMKLNFFPGSLKNTIVDIGTTLHTDNEATQKSITGVFGAVKSNKPMLVSAIILLVIVIVLQLAPMVLGFLK